MNTNIIKIDKFDEKIINSLIRDSRISLKELSSSLQRDKAFVQYRINNLVSKGVIEKNYPLINVSEIGYLPFECYLKTQMDENEESSFIEFLKKQKDIFFIERIIGNFSIRFLFFKKNLEESLKFIQHLNSSIKEKIKNLNVKIITSITRSNSLFGNTKNRFELFSKKSNLVLNNKELQILKEVNKDPRSSIFNLSEKLGYSRSFIKKVISDFNKKDVIKGYTIDVNYSKLGFITRMFLLNIKTLSEEEFKIFKEFLLNSPYVQTFTTYYPNQEVSIEIAAKEVSDIRRFQTEILNKFNNIIEELDILEYYDEPKYSYMEDFLQEL